MFKKVVPDKDYTPNEVPVKERIANAVIALLMVAYGTYGIWNQELYVPIFRGEVTLYGDSLWFAFIAASVGSLYFVLRVIDHYDKRNNEHLYRRFQIILRGVAVLIFIIAILINNMHLLQT